jgi:hypothetical protein
VGVVLALVTVALAVGGCESSQEKSAQLERAAKVERARNPVQASHGLTITQASRAVQVVATQVLHSSEGNAAVVTLHNTSPHALRDVPIAVTVKDAAGGTLYQNNAPGLEAALTSVPLLQPDAQFTWIDDQVQASGVGGAPTTVSAVVGEVPQAPASVPKIAVSGVHPNEEGGSSGAAGTVANSSTVAQKGLVVYGIARRGGRIVAAGRAVLAEVAAHSSSPFQVLFIGSAAGAKLEVSAPPTTF